MALATWGQKAPLKFPVRGSGLLFTTASARSQNPVSYSLQGLTGSGGFPCNPTFLIPLLPTPPWFILLQPTGLLHVSQSCQAFPASRYLHLLFPLSRTSSPRHVWLILPSLGPLLNCMTKLRKTANTCPDPALFPVSFWFRCPVTYHSFPSFLPFFLPFSHHSLLPSIPSCSLSPLFLLEYQAHGQTVLSGWPTAVTLTLKQVLEWIKVEVSLK